MNDATPPVKSKPRICFPHPCWKTSTSTPYAAATESRLSRIAFTAITSERNEKSNRTNANVSTNRNTNGADDFIESLKSFVNAVSPVTPDSVFGTAPSVNGMIWSRRNASEAIDASSVPSPSTGIEMCATVRAGLDRKSTRLNSSHITISYAVFCLKKKKKKNYKMQNIKKKKKHHK